MEDKKTPWLYKVIRWLVWLFSPKYKLVGAEKLLDEPCVIVGNHSQMYGPIAGELYMPGKHCVWCAGEMMHREEVSAYAYQDFWSGKPKGARWFYKILSHLITPLCVLIFNSAQLQPKSSRTTQGVNVMSLKPKRILERAETLSESGITNPARYRVKSLPGAGAILKPEDKNEQQMSLLDE